MKIKPVNEVVPNVVPDPVVPELHAVTVLGVQEMLMGVSPSVSSTTYISKQR